MLPSTAGATSAPAPSSTTTGAGFTAPGGQTVGQGSQRATIYWDAQGIPHVYASTLSGMWFGDGWAQAHDRMFQLELTRAAVEGDLSSLFGSSQLSTDQSQRLFFYTSAEYQAQYDALPASDKAALVAYSAGINAYENAAYATSASQQQLVPEEFWALGSFYGTTGPYRPAPWKPTDTLAIGVYLTRQFGTGGGSELQNLASLQYLQAQFAAKGDPNAAADAMAVFNDANWIKDPTAPTTVPASCPNGPVLTRPSQSRPGVCSPSQTASLTSTFATRPGSVRSPVVLDSTGSSSVPKSTSTSSSSPVVRQEVSSTAALRSLPEHAVLQAANTLSTDEQLLQQRGINMKVFSHEGSDAFAVAPWRSADHHALLWGAPQEGFSTPSVNYEVYLHAPQYDASGMAIAGEPYVLIGHNANVSWTTTSEETMNQGVFVEQVRYTGSPPVPSTYYFDGQWIPVQVVNESIPVLGSSPVPYTIYRTNDGPIFSTDPAKGIAFSMDFTSWMKEYKSLEGFSQFGNDTTLAQFRHSVSVIATVHNFIYADRQGNIAFFSAGLIPTVSPLSTSNDPRLPHLGNGSQQWSTFIPFAQMPHSINPGQGYLDNWNTTPSQQLFYQPDEFRGTIFRSQRISQMLGASTHITLSYLESVEQSIGTIDPSQTRPAAPYFIPFLERAYQKLVAEGDPMVNTTTHPDLAGAMQALTTWNTTTSIGSPAMSIFNQFLLALERNVLGGGVNAGEQYVGGVNFNNASLGLGTFLQNNNFTENMLFHILAGTSGLVPCNTLCYQGHYFGGHRDHVLVESLNDAIAILSGTGPQLSRSVPGFGTTNVAAWGWEPSQSIQWDSLDPVASAAGVSVNCGTSAAQERSSYFLAMDMARVPFGQQLMPPGESGFINAAGVPSTHLCDQVGAFNNFTYFPISSSITGMSPAQGPAGGGSTVVITGHNLTGATAIEFGNQPASSFHVISSTEITAVAPAGSGTVNVRVVTPADPGGTAANTFDRFTYVGSPATTSIVLPVAGTTVRGGIWLDASARSPIGIRSVSFLLTGGTAPAKLIAQGAFTADGWLAGWDSSTVANGTYSIQSVATDSAGGSVTSLPVSITVDNTPLATTVLVPRPGARIAGTMVLDATAVGEHPVRAVMFRISGGPGSRPVRAAARLTLYGWIVELPAGSLAPGAYTVESIATDTAGHRATSAAVTFTVG